MRSETIRQRGYARRERATHGVVPTFVDEEAQACPGSAQADARENVRQVVDLEIQTTESDHGDEDHIGRSADDLPPVPKIPRDEIEDEPVDRGRPRRVSARERVRLQVHERELRPWPVEDELQDWIEELDAERARTEERRFVHPATTHEVGGNGRRDQRQGDDVSGPGHDLEE